MVSALGYAMTSQTADFAPFSFERRDTKPHDVQIEILFCGVCHTDLHTARNEWGMTMYPCVPGHEIVGRVTETGADVTRFKVGDVVGVGCIVDSCRHCEACDEGIEQYCETMFTGTYNGPEQGTGANTYGGYSDKIVVDENYVLNIRHSEADLAAVAPLLCAGITTYSPLKEWRVEKGQTVGVVGLGGLGHMAVKLARAMGAEVVVFTTSPNKREDATRLGASDVVVSRDADDMMRYMGRLDFILNTVAAPHNLDPFLALLKRDATMVMVGVPAEPHPSPSIFQMVVRRRRIGASLIGGIAETQEMLDFCAEKGIVSDIEMMPIQSIERAYDRMSSGDVKYRFVIDMASLKA